MLDIDIKCKKYDELSIIKDFNIQINTSEFISIIGPSGCGKTTLLNIISNLDKEYNGNINFNKKELNDRNIGFMFQDSRLIPWLNVLENLMLISASKNKEEIIQALKEVGLEKNVYSYSKELSGGMQRRVALVRAFLNKPQLLLLDEPFISLDHPTAQALRKDFLNLYNKYLPTVIFVTHDLSEAISLSKRIVFLDSKPMKVIFDYKNNNDFSQDLEHEDIKSIESSILSEHPLILSGKTNIDYSSKLASIS